MKKIIATACLALGVAATASAQQFNQANLYVGGGLNLNSASGVDDEIGYQFFAGYELDNVNLEPVDLAVEVGYMDIDDFGVNGLWATAVFSYELNPQFDLIGRLGLDFGDDDGLMFGAGVGYTVNQQIQVRGEYVIRDNIDSLQANVVYSF